MSYVDIGALNNIRRDLYKKKKKNCLHQIVIPVKPFISHLNYFSVQQTVYDQLAFIDQNRVIL